METFTLADLGVILRNIVLLVVLVMAGVWSWDRRDLATDALAGLVAWCAAAVKRFAPLPSAAARPLPPLAPDGRTDGRTDAGILARTELPPVVAALRLDRTRAALIAVLVDSGWSVTEIRAVVKGENAAISAEVAEATNALAAGKTGARKPLIARDAQGERELSRA